MKKGLISFALMGLVVVSQNSSGSVVESYVKSEATGSNAKVETNTSIKVNETETTVRTNQSGEVEVRVKDGKVEIKTSKGITPTIIISPVPTRIHQEEAEIKQPLFNFIKDFFQGFFGFFGLNLDNLNFLLYT